MSRLIDADALIAYCDEKWIPLNIDAVNAQPTIEERKKGKWNYGDDMFEYAICSACKWDSGEAWEYAKKYFRYYPHCGADMRGDNDV